MSMQYTGYIKSFGNAGFIAGVNELKGMVEQANSPQGAVDKLVLAMRIRVAYMNKVNIDSISVIVEENKKPSQNDSSPNKNPQKELNLVLQS